jgi:hypothetical protein
MLMTSVTQMQYFADAIAELDANGAVWYRQQAERRLEHEGSARRLDQTERRRSRSTSSIGRRGVGADGAA